MTSDQDSSKRNAGYRVAELVEPGMCLGLGSGSTVFYFMKRLGERIEAESLEVAGVPTSRGTERTANSLGIPLTTLSEHPRLDLDVDGADEVDPELNLIKGGGGALVREKIVAKASSRLVVVVDESKVVSRLGERWAVPVEVVPFGAPAVERRVVKMGASVNLRVENDEPYITDNGNMILDCRFKSEFDPVRMERDLKYISGVVDNGLFTGLTDTVIVGTGSGYRTLSAT